MSSSVAPTEDRAPRRVLALAWVGSRVRRTSGLNGSLAVGLTIVGVLMLLAIFADVLTPYDPLDQDVANALAAPSSDHLLGTDPLGRDVLSRLLHGARIDLFVAIGAVVWPFVIGVTVGTVAGYRGGVVDRVVVALVNIVFAFPVFILLIALVFALGPGIVTIIVAVTAVSWVAYARLARDLARRERSKEYVLAARVSGIPTRRILARHILPNVISQPVIYAMADVVAVILFITALGYLGLGVPPPAPDWGTMIADAQPYLGEQWWLAVAPGVMICVAGLGLSLVADGLARKWDAR